MQLPGRFRTQKDIRASSGNPRGGVSTISTRANARDVASARIVELDGIRGLAAILVLVFHVLAAGNMFSVSTRGSDAAVLFSGRVMLVSAFALGVLTLLLPVPLTWFAIAYAAVGFTFSAAYAVALFGSKNS